jgi:2-alkenal reductase
LQDRLTRFALFAFLGLAVAYVAEPYVTRYFYAQTAPRAIAPRGDLATSERATIELFERTSPSVVHVFAEPDPRRLAQEGPVGPFGPGPGPGDGEGGGTQSGTGFVGMRPATS